MAGRTMKGFAVMQGRAVPLVDMQVRRHICGQARGGRRPPHWLDAEVGIVHASFPHAHVAEVEVLLPQCVSSKQRLGWRQVAAVAPRAGNGGGRVHGSQWRRHLHGGGDVRRCGVGAAGGRRCGGRGAASEGGGRRCCGRSRCSLAARDGDRMDGGGEPISI